MQERARALEKFLDGQFYEMGLYQLMPMIILDGGGIFGTGLPKFFIDGEGKDARIRVERVIPFEVLVDEQEGLRARPRNLLHEAWVDRLVLLEMFRDDERLVEKIKQATRAHDENIGQHGGLGYDSTADQLLVTEGWHLASGRSATDGKHGMAIQGAMLVYEPWEFDFFPFTPYRKQPSPLGWWGIGLADQLNGLQDAINSKLFRIDKGLRLLGAGHILIHSGSKVNFSQWDNEQGSKIEYTGVKPEFFMPTNVVPDQMFAALDRDYDKSFEIPGIPRAQAEGSVPDNLDSGKAQEVYLQTTDQRLNVYIHAYHDLFLDIAKVVLAFARKIVRDHNPNFAAKVVAEKGEMRKILLREVDIDEEDYLLRRWPTRLFAEEPGAKIAQIERMLNAGMIAPDAAKRELYGHEYGDIKGQVDLENASYEAVEYCIAKMLDDGKWIQPQPYLNLQQGIIQVQLALVKGWKEGRPEARLQLLRDWIQQAKDMPNEFGAAPAPVQMMASTPGTPVAAAPAAGVTPMVGAPPGAAPGPAMPP